MTPRTGNCTHTVRLSNRCLLGRIALRLATPGARIAQLLAVWKRDLQELAARVPAPQRMDEELDVHTRPERLRKPALPDQTSWRAELDRPLNRVALSIGDHQVNPAVRIAPQEFLDAAFEGHGLFSIEHRKGMMRRRRDRINGN